MASENPILTLHTLQRQSSLLDIDVALAESIGRRGAETTPSVLWAIALTSRAVREGHICLDLAAYAGMGWPPVVETELPEQSVDRTHIDLPELNGWQRVLRNSPVIGVPGEDTPLILVCDATAPRLYLRRYYGYEQTVVLRLKALGESEPAPQSHGPAFEKHLSALFPVGDADVTAQPRKAAEIILSKRLLILSGGPGTGKTYTLARLLTLLVQQDMAGNRERTFAMAAPTGKAAMRMRESIRNAKQQLKLPNELAQRIPENAGTLHRLLGTVPDSPYFRHHQNHPLAADVIIVDEASMIDLPMMAKLLDAMKPDSQLILLGDMHQLSSVEPGYVLGDICAAAQRGHGSPLDGTLVELTHSWRFRPDGPIGRLSAALQQAGSAKDPDGEQAWATAVELNTLPPSERDEALRLIAPNSAVTAIGSDTMTGAAPGAQSPRDALRRPVKSLRKIVLSQFAAFLEAAHPEAAFHALQGFRILCALRRGPFGVQALNGLVEEILSLRNMTDVDRLAFEARRRLNPAGKAYDHRVIMVTRNDYGLRLFNGDIGVILPANADGRELTEESNRLVAWFEPEAETEGGAPKRFRPIPCSLLPEHETAFAMTIHKSQGSQFTNILLMLPPDDSAILTKELLYTGLTRAEKYVWLWCRESLYKQAALRRTRRSSGLARL